MGFNKISVDKILPLSAEGLDLPYGGAVGAAQFVFRRLVVAK